MAGNRHETVAWGGEISLDSLQEQGTSLGSMLGREQPTTAWSMMISGASKVQHYDAGDCIALFCTSSGDSVKAALLSHA